MHPLTITLVLLSVQSSDPLPDTSKISAVKGGEEEEEEIRLFTTRDLGMPGSDYSHGCLTMGRLLRNQVAK